MVLLPSCVARTALCAVLQRGCLAACRLHPLSLRQLGANGFYRGNYLCTPGPKGCARGSEWVPVHETSDLLFQQTKPCQRNSTANSSGEPQPERSNLPHHGALKRLQGLLHGDQRFDHQVLHAETDMQRLAMRLRPVSLSPLPSPSLMHP